MTKSKRAPFQPPGDAESAEARELREHFERELRAVRKADDERIKELETQVRTLKRDLIRSGRVLAHCGSLLDEAEKERKARDRNAS